MSHVFVSHDAEDNKGIRAEVRVEVGEGTISAIDDSNAKAAQISVKADNLKLPVKGWVGKDTDLFRAAQEAMASGERISFRVEVQRKPNIDRSLPIEEVRGDNDTKTARENTKRIFSAIKLLEGARAGEFIESPEALTEPSEDPNGSQAARAPKGGSAPGGSNTSKVDATSLLKAVEAASDAPVSSDVLGTVVGVAIALGANPDEVFAIAGGIDRASNDGERPEQRTSFSSEAAPWKEWNSDGRPNLGLTRYAAGVGAEHFVREELTKDGQLEGENLEEAVKYFSVIVLSIADRVQVKAYGQGFRADRGATSHARARGVVYDTIKNYNNIPLTPSADYQQIVTNWIAEVGGASYNRFMVALQASDSGTNFKLPIPAFLTGNTSSVSTKKVEKPETVVVTTATNVPVEVPKTEPSEAETKPDAKSSKSVDEKPAKAVKEPTVDAATSETSVDVSGLEKLMIYAPVKADAIKGQPLASEETVEEFADLIKSLDLSTADLSRVSNLLRYTFGVSKAKDAPEEQLGDMLEFYIAAGDDNLKEILQKLPPVK